jgi:hypothetical protein
MLLGRFFSQFTAQPTNAGGRVNDPPLQRVCAKLKFVKNRALQKIHTLYIDFSVFLLYDNIAKYGMSGNITYKRAPQNL